MNDEIATRPRGTKKRIAAALGITMSDLRHYLIGKRGKLDCEQIGIVADELEAPSTWPWKPWREAAAIDAMEALVAEYLARQKK